MTPFELSVLLHYYSAANDFRDGDFSAPIFDSLLPQLIDGDELLEVNDNPPILYEGRKYATYRITDRGRAYIDHILTISLPTKKWVIE